MAEYTVKNVAIVDGKVQILVEVSVEDFCKTVALDSDEIMTLASAELPKAGG